ncbi:hypothetical protein D931_03802 [Enterococcus faecium 13.SD.W.09]|nr:hypothetical protein D931_03802 [Enterococcus faecium 13.SD.W.09]
MSFVRNAPKKAAISFLRGAFCAGRRSSKRWDFALVFLTKRPICQNHLILLVQIFVKKNSY